MNGAATSPSLRTRCATLARPLYAWIEDMKPGDRSGDGFDKTRSLARP